ncbi:unnamed protein product [Euphydryas editha]|uniref:Uncharacterized protein n=1 Tax=Euphydryas editha TaxID=104508 RepID=A0AAU9TE27_EUPED|nr:unnamed protein product [Euphydryas editha]
MENIRIIKEKIRSCISCDENQCPRIKERLDHHVQSHHSSLKRSYSQQITTSQNYSRIIYPSRSNISNLKTDEQTSTSSLFDDKETGKVNTSSYKEGLRAIVFEFIKNLRKNQNGRYSNKEENIINEFIEKISEISLDHTDDKYDISLDIEIDDFLNSLSANIDKQNEKTMTSFKADLATKIIDFNTKNLDNFKIKNENTTIDQRKNSLEDKNTTSDSVRYVENNKRDATVQSSDVDILINSISDTNNALSRFRSNNISKVRKRSVDTQFPSLSGTFYVNTIEHTNLNKNRQNYFKDVLTNEKNYLQEKDTYFINHFEKNIGTNTELDEIKSIINETVAKNLVKYNFAFYSETITKEIVELLSENLQISQINNSELEVKLFNLIKSTTDLSDVITDEIVNSVIKTLKSSKVEDILKHYSSVANNKNKHYFSNVISVFKSEQNLLDHSDNPSPPIRKRKSSILKKTKTNSEEQMYSEKLIALIKAWLDILPKKQNKAKDKKLKEGPVNNLIEDILDQVKLEQVAPETRNEKEKYISFFIFRWLNKYKYFEDINEAKPYVDQLIEKMKEIPVPNLIKTQTDSQKATQSIQMTNNIDILRNEVSKWFTEQPNKLFLEKEKSERNETIQKIALKMHDIINNCSPDNLNNEIQNWLSEILKPEHKQNIKSLAETLQNKIEKLTQNEKNYDIDSQRQMEGKKGYNSCCGETLSENVASEGTIKELFEIYLEHKYNSENFIARKAYTELFKNELNKLNTLSKKENNVCPNLKQQQANTLEILSKELQYIKIIADWMLELPLQESLNKTQNIVEAEAIINIAKHIREIDDDVQQASSQTEYNHRISLIINEVVEKLPISTNFKMQEKIYDLTRQIAAVKYNSPVNCCTINNVSNRNLTDYIEAYIRENDEEIFEDDLKLESCILRLFREINNKTNQNMFFNDTSISNKFTDTSLNNNETIKYFSLKMNYAKEISDWIKNLPLLSLTDKATQNQLVDLVNDLAKKISDTENDSEIKEYITNWISKLPLDLSKQIIMPVVIQQIMNRIKRVQKGYMQKENEIPTASQKLEKENRTDKVCEYPHSCCNKTITCEDNRDPATVIEEYIEEWCNNLPVQAENETISKTLKENVASKLFQKFGELNMNPEYFNNNILYEEMFSEEIDTQLENLPQNPTLQNLKKELKRKFLDVIIEQRNKIKTKISGVEYKHDLEKTIEISMPNAIPTYKEDSPGFKIYKDRVATMFILENFDHGNDEIKLNYEKKIRKQIDKYFHEIRDNSSGPLTKDQIYNELYSVLFNVPLPIESSMIDEVEEIKTRCEIDNWFETLPLREATGLGELLEWDQILAMLAKRLHQFEKYENGSDNKMHKEITKWLARLPILPQHTSNIDKFANDLQQRLNLTQANRRHVPRKINKSQQSIVDQDKNMFNSSESVEPRSLQVTLPSSLPTCCQTSIQKPKKPADMIVDVVETWCQQLPLPANTQQEKDNTKIIKDNLIIKIIMKISELNMNPEIFNDDFLYDALLDDELENLMSKLPASYEFIQSKNARKNQLKEAIKSVKPLIKEDKARYEYKVEVKNTVDKILKDPPESDSEKKIWFDSLKEEIVDNIIIYNFHKEDQENSFKYKTLVHDAVDKYYSLIDEDGGRNIHTRRDSLMKSNELLCESAKVPTPGENAIQEEIQEIEIKFELTKFLNEVSFNDKEKFILKNQIKTTLAKQLNYSITAGDILRNKNKIKENFIRTLKKIDDNIDSQKVETFINQIQHFIGNTAYNSRILHYNADKQNKLTQNDKASIEVQEADNSKEKTTDEQWLSLLPVTPSPPKAYNDYYELLNSHNFRKTGESVSSNQNKQGFDPSFNKSGITYESFEKGTLLSSSVINHQEGKEKANEYQESIKRTSTTTTNQNISSHPSKMNKAADKSLFPNQTYKPLSQDKNLEYRAFESTESDNAQKNKSLQRDQNSFEPLELTQINQNVDQAFTDQENQIQYPRQIQSQPDRPRIPDSKTMESLYIENGIEQRRQQETSSMSSQTSNQDQVSAQEQYNQNSQIPANRFLIKTQDACTQVTGHSHAPSVKSIPNEPIPFQNFQEQSPFIPSTSIATGRISPGRISPQKPMIRSCNRGQPCRRPSITIFSPTELPRCNEFNQAPSRCNTKIPEELELCECLKKRKRPNLCSAHMRRHCRICNETNPFYCRLPSYRYPSFYYHRF